MGAMSKIWDDDHVDTYSKYLMLRGHLLQSSTVGTRKLGTMEVPSSFPRSFPAQGDKKNIEGKDVSGIQTAHHKYLNKGKYLQHSNDQEPDYPSSVDLPWKDISTRRFKHPELPTNGVE